MLHQQEGEATGANVPKILKTFPFVAFPKGRERREVEIKRSEL